MSAVGKESWPAVAPLASSRIEAVTGAGSPPEAETRKSGESLSGEKRMTPSRFQAPPRLSAAAQIVLSAPPLESTATSFSRAGQKVGDGPAVRGPEWLAPPVTVNLRGSGSGESADPDAPCPT